jgi:PP-loop superfamily ATP-utilizing enzyme
LSNFAAEAALIKTKQHIEDTKGKIVASISGGADSDVMLDLIERARGGADRRV